MEGRRKEGGECREGTRMKETECRKKEGKEQEGRGRMDVGGRKRQVRNIKNLF